MENGCPFMMSWNTGSNEGFITARDSDVIAHERTGHWYNPDGIFCAVHGGKGNLNSFFFDDIRIENYQWGLVSIHIANNPWGTASQLGSVSTVLLRNVTSALPFSSPGSRDFYISEFRFRYKTAV